MWDAVPQIRTCQNCARPNERNARCPRSFQAAILSKGSRPAFVPWPLRPLALMSSSREYFQFDVKTSWRVGIPRSETTLAGTMAYRLVNGKAHPKVRGAKIMH